MPVAVLSKKKIIWHLHGKFLYGDFFFKIINFFCYRVLVPSHAIKEALPNSKKINVLYNGFEFREMGNVPYKNSNVLKILFVGVFTPQKGVHLLLEALSLYKNKNKKIELTLVGDILDDDWKWYADLLNEKIKLLPENISICTPGWVKDVSLYLKLGDYLIFPSQHSCELLINNVSRKFYGSEALPTVLIEAQAMNLPVIANDVPGVREIVQVNGGFVVNMNSVDDILFIIERIAKEPRNMFTVKSEETRRKFSLDAMRKQLYCLIP
ncbi:glycosyltransferase family 4 protein [Escherichia coli]|uniref:glycosyltransferase family 4 protein n=1 Tax=Escherichia coli TaxID=562 RepID=UPI00184F7604|nr:glycosyltransferase family 4 protein [Escherichia coli]MCD9327597.1 glycosyltransferase family 4 protein [Escherichia coli]MCX9794042.1 glycosyltransferase family 4 protein [Escherichia coli]HAJ6910564.1 glycosyltransferase [Escherichia coli]